MLWRMRTATVVVDLAVDICQAAVGDDSEDEDERLLPDEELLPPGNIGIVRDGEEAKTKAMFYATTTALSWSRSTSSWPSILVTECHERHSHSGLRCSGITNFVAGS
ncbi:hypothetical protein JG688_00010288 [Phytophthora aleatoria]|uniref:Secreted protein n=1 Tax=Phytophthora aleatoria TaxID=2496075 RepID=A0A8J5J5T6_9STRA|nr:hypothetical protein JG688_00010288 [Phytophthora aleatoria]